MFVRIARFEGASANWEERIEEVRSRMRQAMSSGNAPPAQRSLMLVDRENGRGAAVSFCATEEDVRKVDEFMNSQTLPAGGGTRASVEVYEVAVDSDELS